MGTARCISSSLNIIQILRVIKMKSLRNNANWHKYKQLPVVFFFLALKRNRWNIDGARQAAGSAIH